MNVWSKSDKSEGKEFIPIKLFLIREWELFGVRDTEPTHLPQVKPRECLMGCANDHEMGERQKKKKQMEQSTRSRLRNDEWQPWGV